MRAKNRISFKQWMNSSINNSEIKHIFSKKTRRQLVKFPFLYLFRHLEPRERKARKIKKRRWGWTVEFKKNGVPGKGFKPIIFICQYMLLFEKYNCLRFLKSFYLLGLILWYYDMLAICSSSGGVTFVWENFSSTNALISLTSSLVVTRKWI